MLNSDFTLQCAQQLVQNAMVEVDDPSAIEQFVGSMFERLLGRQAQDQEVAWIKDLVSDSKDLPQGLITAAIAILNCNEFVYVD